MNAGTKEKLSRNNSSVTKQSPISSLWDIPNNLIQSLSSAGTQAPLKHGWNDDVGPPDFSQLKLGL